MNFGLSLPNFGAYGTPQIVLDLACAAEQTGWNGVFLWDHLVWPSYGATTAASENVIDSWLLLAAIASTTKSIILGPVVTPLPRRRPWKVAREIATLDHLSGGRTILGVGLGAFQREEYDEFGEAGSVQIRAEKLDEGLSVLTGLWSTQPFSFNGQHYAIHEQQFRPLPLQKPRVPIWVACTWPDNKRSLRRAARWDGAVPVVRRHSPITPEEIQALVAFIHSQRPPNPNRFDVVVSILIENLARDVDKDNVQRYQDAGATWLVALIDPHRVTPDRAMEHILRGPPES